jgi:hypothetical protein
MDSLEYIDGYFNKDPSAEEARLFEKKIQDDPIFAEEVAFYLSAYSVLREEQAEEKKKNFREIYRQTDAEEIRFTRTRVRRLMTAIAAAAIIAGILLCWYWWISPVSTPQLADRYIQQNLEMLSVNMGPGDPMQNGLNLYNNKKIPEALQQFENIIRTDSSNSAAMVYAGIASLRIQDYNKALEYFNILEKRSYLQINPALFYEALTLMKRNRAGDAAHAKLLLQEIVQKGLIKKEDAQLLLGKM